MRDFQTPGRSLVFARNGICALAHPLAAQAVALEAAGVLIGASDPRKDGCALGR